MQDLHPGRLMTSITRKAQIYFRSHHQTEFYQLINEPIHVQCNDLLFDQPKLSVNSGVHASLHPNCRHQIVYTSFNLNISYFPPCQRLIWDYKKADSEKIRKALVW